MVYYCVKNLGSILTFRMVAKFTIHWAGAYFYECWAISMALLCLTLLQRCKLSGTARVGAEHDEFIYVWGKPVRNMSVCHGVMVNHYSCPLCVCVFVWGEGVCMFFFTDHTRGAGELFPNSW